MARLMPSIALSLILCITLVACAPSHKKKNAANVHYTLGLSYVTEGRHSDALREFLLAENIDKRDPKIQASLGDVYLTKAAYIEAERHFLRAYRLDKENARHQNNLGALYLTIKKFDDAITYFTMAANNLFANQPEVSWSGIGYTHMQKGDFLAAMAAFQKAIEVNYRYPVAYLKKGEMYYKLGKISDAIQEYKLALEYAPNYTEAHHRLGLAYAKSKEVAKAIVSFKKVVEISPKSDFANQAKQYLAILD